MSDNHSKIQSIVDICGCNEGTALRFLEAARFDLNSAINNYLESGGVLPSSSSAPPAYGPPPNPTAAPAQPALKKPALSAAQAAEAHVSAELGSWTKSLPTEAEARKQEELRHIRAARQVKFEDPASSSANHNAFVDPQQLSIQPRDSDGRIKRARPFDAGPSSPSGASQSAFPASSSSSAANLEGTQRTDDMEPMQLDTPPSEPASSQERTGRPGPDFASIPEEEAARGWDQDFSSLQQQQQQQQQQYRGGGSGLGKRGPSPPPRPSSSQKNENRLIMPASSTAGNQSAPDYDPDLERALQASLVDQGGNGQVNSIEDNDADLAAAIQASMSDVGMVDSWYSTVSASGGPGGGAGTNSAGTGNKDGGSGSGGSGSARREAAKVPDHLASIRTKDDPKAPTALAAPFESLKIFPLIMHALYALPPIRRGFQKYEMERLSGINDLSYFWTGVPAGRRQNAPGLGRWVSNDEREKADVVQRLQVLFYFTERSARPVCMTSSVLEVLPQSLMTLNSGSPDPADLAMFTANSLFDAYRIAVRAVAGRHAEEQDQEDWISDRMRIFDTAVSYGIPDPTQPEPQPATAAATEGGALSSSEQKPGPVMPTPARNPLTTFNSTHLELRHTAVANDMMAAVLTVLEDDSALVTVPGETLCVGIKHEAPPVLPPPPADKGKGKMSGGEEPGGAGTPSGMLASTWRPWKVDAHFYADPFLWERRGGVPLGQAAEERNRNEETRQKREEIQERIRRRKWLAAPANKDAIALMNDSIAYLEGPGQQSEDPIRVQTNQEAAAKLRQMRDHVVKEITTLDEVIQADQERLAKVYVEKIEAFRKQYEGKPEWQTVRYDLRAILMKDGDGAWAYIQHRGQWYRVQDGHIHATDEATALNDHTGADKGGAGGVFFLGYVRADAMMMMTNVGVNVSVGADGVAKVLREGSEAEKEGMREMLEHGLEGPVLPPEPFMEALDNDNEEYEAILLSLPTDGSSPIGLRRGSSGGHGMMGEINLGGLLKQEHEMRSGGGGGGDGGGGGGGEGGVILGGGLGRDGRGEPGSPSSVVVEIDLRDEK
ncbi:hypothetical protein OC861_003306 [Tilletia horrida]|nr:hypothetical protein OC861_003306 [Tilletia horrida]